MAFNTSAPKQITWVVCLVLYVVALLAQFGSFGISGTIALWSWVIGFGVLLVAALVKGL
ncbi:MAG: hypothetical protein M3Y87_27085 [Myxococcota bacterium]|nr:hypothetical protein [Myxococcota bacterium]